MNIQTNDDYRQAVVEVSKDVLIMQRSLCDLLDDYAHEIKKQMADILLKSTGNTSSGVCYGQSHVKTAFLTTQVALVELVSAAENLDQAYTVLGAVIDDE